MAEAEVEDIRSRCPLLLARLPAPAGGRVVLAPLLRAQVQVGMAGGWIYPLANLLAEEQLPGEKWNEGCRRGRRLRGPPSADQLVFLGLLWTTEACRPDAREAARRPGELWCITAPTPILWLRFRGWASGVAAEYPGGAPTCPPPLAP